MGTLAAAASSRNFSTAPEAVSAWQSAILGLQRAAKSLTKTIPGAAELGILLEYEVPRRNRRIYAVILSHRFINLIELKVGAHSFSRDARE